MYRCEGCGKPIGLIADNKGNPVLYKCFRTGMAYGPQQAIRRKPKPKPKTPEQEGIS